VDEINTDNSTSIPHHATIVRSVLPTARSEKKSLILRLIMIIPISKMYHIII